MVEGDCHDLLFKSCFEVSQMKIGQDLRCRRGGAIDEVSECHCSTRYHDHSRQCRGRERIPFGLFVKPIGGDPSKIERLAGEIRHHQRQTPNRGSNRISVVRRRMVGAARMAVNLGQEFQAAFVEPDIEPVQFFGRNDHANAIVCSNVTLRRDNRLCYGKVPVFLNADPKCHPLIALATN